MVERRYAVVARAVQVELVAVVVLPRDRPLQPVAILEMVMCFGFKQFVGRILVGPVNGITEPGFDERFAVFDHIQ
ncbi:hypothetical protein D3C87_1750320 [compost metagenome]